MSAAKDAVGGANGYSGQFGDEKSFMLWFDGKGVAHFKKCIVVIGSKENRTADDDDNDDDCS